MQQSLRNFFSHHGTGKKYWIAYSGGLDSHVLLSLCHALRAELNLNLRAIHVNHGISSKASAWALHCNNTCENYDIEYIEHEIKIVWKSGESLEEVARKKRYAVFSNYIAEDDILLTAHHQDDQAETVLLQLFRGSGLKGLAAMPEIKSFGNGLHARPLLSFSRKNLLEYAKNEGLIWIEDESNQDTTFRRNYLRHEIIPQIKSYWPAMTSALSRSASHCAESQLLLDELASELYEQTRGSKINTLSVAKLKQLTMQKQRLVLRYWIKQHLLPLPNTHKMKSIQENVLQAASDKLPKIKWGQAVIKRYRDDVYLMSAQSFNASQEIFDWDLKQPLILPGVGKLKVQETKDRGLSPQIKKCKVRYRQEGETVTLLKRGKHHLKNLFQEWGVPPWQRSITPLIFIDDYLVAAVGYFFDSNYTAKENEIGRDIYFVMLCHPSEGVSSQRRLGSMINGFPPARE